MKLDYNVNCYYDSDAFDDYLKKHPKMPLKKAVENFNYSIKRQEQRNKQKSKTNYYGKSI